MTSTELKEARRQAGWTQARLAERLGVTQAYVSLLEKGRRQVPVALARHVARLLSLPPTSLPFPGLEEVSKPTTNEWVEQSLARLGYPGYAHRRRPGAGRNPIEVLLRALNLDDLEPRLAEALPWLLLAFGVADPSSLVDRARSLNVQNRLGFVAALAQDVAEKGGARAHRVDELRRLQESLEPCRLAREDTLGQSRISERMRNWIRGKRSQSATHWNILTDLKAEHLFYGP